MAKIRRIFPGGNTSKGFVSLHDNIIGENRKMLYILKGMPGGGKSSMMREIGDTSVNEGYSVEYHHCPSDPNSIDGIVINELGIAIVDGTAPHIIDPVYPGITDKIIDLAIFIDKDNVIDKKEEIVNAKKANKVAYRKAFNYFKAAKFIYNEIEESNKALVDIEAINKKGKELIDQVFSKEEKEVDSNGFRERHLFSSATTPQGFVDYTDTILEGVSEVYYINGEIGTGKSTLLYRILEKSRTLNYNIEVYHDSMFPEKIQSLYIKDLDTIITSNEIGKDFTKNIIDFNEYIDLDRLNREDYEFYDSLVKKGIENLAKAKENHFILEKAYNPAINYNGITKVKKTLLKEILG